MKVSSKPSLLRSRSIKGALVLVALLGSAVVAASPAGAETTCVEASDDGSLIVAVDESNGAETELEVIDGVLFVNDVACGTGTTINIIDDAEVGKVDRVKINLGPGPFRMNGQAVFVNLRLDDNGPGGERDEVRVRGTAGVDQVRLLPDFISVNRDTPFPGSDALRLAMGISGSDAEFDIRLRGGPDTFIMSADGNGDFFDGSVSVRGGSGADELVAGPCASSCAVGADPTSSRVALETTSCVATAEWTSSTVAVAPTTSAVGPASIRSVLAAVLTR